MPIAALLSRKAETGTNSHWPDPTSVAQINFDSGLSWSADDCPGRQTNAQHLHWQPARHAV